MLSYSESLYAMVQATHMFSFLLSIPREIAQHDRSN